MPTILKLAVIVSGHLFLIMGRPFKVDKNAIGYTSMYARWRCSFCATRSTFKLMDIFRRIIQWWIYMWYFVRKNFYCPVWKEKRTLYVPIIISYRVNSKYPRWFRNEHTYLGFSIYIRKHPLSGDGNVLSLNMAANQTKSYDLSISLVRESTTIFYHRSIFFWDHSH